MENQQNVFKERMKEIENHPGYSSAAHPDHGKLIHEHIQLRRYEAGDVPTYDAEREKEIRGITKHPDFLDPLGFKHQELMQKWRKLHGLPEKPVASRIENRK